VADLARALRAIPSRQVLVVINACFAGHLGPRLSQGRIGPDALTALPDAASNELLATGEGRAIISASKPDQRSYYDSKADHSYFGQALIQALKGGPESERSGSIGLYELYTTIHRQVASAAARAHHTQEPTLTLVQGVGPFVVAAYPHAAGQGGRIGQEPPAGAAVRELPPAGGPAVANAEIAGVVDLRGADFSNASGVTISGVTIGAMPQPKRRPE
jgi:hypothetical protein